MFRSIVTGTTFALLACGLLSTACISAQHPREASDRAAQVAYLYGYVAQVDGSAPRSIHMRGSLQAIERDPSGKLTRSFAPLRSAHCGS